jgi:hypothetical protein
MPRVVLRRGGAREVYIGRRVLEMAADNKDATSWKGARWTSTSHVDVEPPRGVGHDAKQARGGSQVEERHGLPAEVMKIARRRKARYGGFRSTFSYPISFEDGASIHMFEQPLP